MSDIHIKPSKLAGTVKIPPSKSAAHRAIICAALSDGVSKIYPISESKDMSATVNAMRALGAEVKKDGDTLTVKGVFSGKERNNSKQTIDCIESGSTLRFLIPIAAALGGDFTFTGQGRLPQRPISCYDELLTSHSVKVEYNGTLPFSFKGKLTPGVFKLPGDVSSQYVTGLLLALVLLNGDSEIIMTSPLQSKAYVDITVSVMKDFGVLVSPTENGYFVKGSQRFTPREYNVEGDWSQGAFFLCADALGAQIEVKGLGLNSLQGDREILTALEKMGAEIKSDNNSITLSAKELCGTVIDAQEIPDIIPILALTACFCKTETHFKNCARLRIKESDRLESTRELIVSLGGKAEIKGDELIVFPSKLKGGSVNGYNDHRIVMSAAIAAAFSLSDTTISDRESINKSYPEFFEDYKKLGGNIYDF